MAEPSISKPKILKSSELKSSELKSNELKSNELKPMQISIKQWYRVLFFLTLLFGALFTYYVAKAQDMEMRDNLITYAATIEQSIDWRPYATTLNTHPSQLKESDMAELETQLNSACKVNRDCHFIYLLYMDKGQVKFLLDASPQPPSEISHLGEVYVEGSEELKQGLLTRNALVEGPVTDHWGTWVSAHVPLTTTVKTPNFVMLGVDVAVNNWNTRIFKKTIVPIISTLVFSVILLGFMYQSRVREQLLTQLYSSQSALSELANNDALTALPNRRLLEDRMAQALKEASRAQQIVAVLFLDLDYFKVVNDTYGHVIGDQLLKKVAERLTALLRAEDTVARIGGDEFVILLTKLNDEQQVVTTAEKVISEFAKPFHIAEQTLLTGVSIGIAFYPQHDDDPASLIKYADDAMYVAKRLGRNCYAIYQPK
jgi:diguanylate cyclase (GGDEF)-like protein